MKNIFSLLFIFSCIFTMAQKKFDYDSQWKLIEKQEANGLLKSNLLPIQQIYAQAKKEHNTPQIIKSLLYQSKVLLLTSDEKQIDLQIIDQFEKEISATQGADQAILQSMLAELYFTYYQQNRWEINERTKTEQSTGTDFRFWTENSFQEKTAELYLQSIKNERTLQNEPIAKWSYNLIRVTETEALRPTLYDLLAHRAIAYFKAEPDFYFRRNVAPKLTQENQVRSIAILKNLSAFHQKKHNQEAYLYNELERLKLENKDELSEVYLDQLTQLSKKFPQANYTAYILNEIADFYLKQIQNEQEKAFAAKKSWTEKAMAVFAQIRAQYPNSPLIDAIEGKEKQLLQPSFALTIEKYVSPDISHPMAVTHQNLATIYVKVLAYDTEDKLIQSLQNADQNNKQKAIDQLLSKLPLVKAFELNLKAFDDYQTHATVAQFEGLKTGKYIVLASNDANFKVNDLFILQSQILNVTPYSIVSRDNEILVTERASGKIVANQQVEVYQQNNQALELLQTLTTDAKGMAKIHATKYYNNFILKIKGEAVTYNNYVYNSNRDNNETTLNFTQLFTDRSIYRPGQTVYFKAIAFEENPEGKKKIIANKTLNISLYNANYDEVTTMELKTNEFGSASGEFILPTAGITGQFHLEEDDSGDSHYFSVEEYKRPRFEVEFDDVKETYQLEEEIIAKGKATAYSGANIDHAKVVYRVYRQEIFPYWPWWKRGYFPHAAAEEITFGETTTDASGKFEIPFKARAAAQKKDQQARTYTYNIVADVTDANGETRSSEQSITVGDLRYLFNFKVADQIEMNHLDSIEISTQNLNGQFAAAKGQITLTKINPPNRILRDSPIQKGDYELYSKEEFIDYFPHEAYADENDKANWTKENPVISVEFDTEKSKFLKLQPKKWQAGYYVLKGSIQDGKDTITTEKLIYLYHQNKKQPIENELFSINLDKNAYQPGDQAKVQLASAAENATVLVELEHDGKIIQTEIIKLNNSVKDFSFPIKETYRGNVFVHYYFGKFNTVKQGTLTVNVPLEDKSLKITARTLRDKLQPGQKETWELTVSGEGKDKFLAEMLATMYDASLDQFQPHSNPFPMNVNWNASIKQNWNTYMAFTTTPFQSLINSNRYYPKSHLAFDQLNWFGFSWNRYDHRLYRMKSMNAPAQDSATITDMLQGEAAGVNLESVEETNSYKGNIQIRGISSLQDNPNALYIVDGVPISADQINPDDIINLTILKVEEATDLYGARGANGVVIITTKKGEEKLNQVLSRRNLQETAFFYPHLKTDEKGNIKIQFTVPESLTAWKFMATAHTPDLRTGYFETTVRTQKELMVVPNPPRFLREGDQITFSSKVTNLSDKTLNGQAKLMLFDAFTMQAVDVEFANSNATKNIEIPQGNSATVSWNLTIPTTYQAIVYRIVASAGDFSDGEESALPILSNRMMVTETLPIHVREGQDKTFTLDKLKNNSSESLDHFKLTFEMTSNPIWYAIFSLPYLREYPYECSEQVFARLYGNLISQHLMHSNPKIKAIFDDWNQKGALTSKLEQNQELKALLLEETPWIRQAESEEEQMKRIALLFDLNKMQNELTNAFQQLSNKQSRNGGFAWFEGGEESRYITAHIVAGFGHLKAMGVDIESKLTVDLHPILKGAIQFMDQKMQQEFDLYLNNKKMKPSNYNGVQYLYARSYFLDKFPLDKKGQQIRDHFLKEFEQNQFEETLSSQAMLAMIFNRFSEIKKAEKLLKSIKDHAVESDEMGMYWKSNVAGWRWNQAPIETQALLIEAFDEVLNDIESVESMKIWLLKNRQTNQWNSTKATTEAVFALMSTGKDWTNSEEGISVKIGGNKLDLKALDKAPQSGSGYVKTSWTPSEIKPEMATVEVHKTSPGVAWGAMYWQYFEDLDKITSAATGVKFNKELFLKKNSDQGPILTKITESTPIQVGDLVTVRLEIQTDRDMEFVHIKDMRASGFEPTNVLSTYKRQGRLGYYESTRDAATNFFVDFMPKGTYVFEYDVRANNEGNFSNGITSLQNMYAPELSAQSEGIRVNIQSAN